MVHTHYRAFNKCVRRIACVLCVAVWIITIVSIRSINIVYEDHGWDTATKVEIKTVIIRPVTSKTRNPFAVMPDITVVTLPNRTDEKIDWNDFQLMERDRGRSGPGEHGAAVVLTLSPEMLEQSRRLYSKYNYDVSVSRSISLERSVKDFREEICKKQLFLKNIPENSVSVIIPFHDEHDATILRTVHGVVNRSPPSLLREIILVDDASTSTSLKSPLEDYVRRYFTKVKIIRTSQRLGLISTRVAGADASTGQFLVFLDAHIEVGYNFLPPLIEPMVLDYKTVTSPVVDIINKDNFHLTSIPHERNAFSWDLQNQHLPILKKDKKKIPEPYGVPVMLGCAFAISRRWWEKIEKFDPGLKIWGAEQYELSFKTWQCGGRMVDAPCSRVAHLFRQLPYSLNGSVGQNYVRLASVWMDEYKEYVFLRRPELRTLDPGDISKQLALRKRLNCKTFKWYVTEIAPDIAYNWPLVEPPPTGWGTLICGENRQYCLSLSSLTEDRSPVLLRNCSAARHKDQDNLFQMVLTWRKVIKARASKSCLEANLDTKSLQSSNFRLNSTRQQFGWDPQRRWIVSLATGKCLNANLATMKIKMEPCEDLPHFWWAFEHFNETRVFAEWKTSTSKLERFRNPLFKLV